MPIRESVLNRAPLQIPDLERRNSKTEMMGVAYSRMNRNSSKIKFSEGNPTPHASFAVKNLFLR